MNLIQLLQIILEAARNYVATGTDYKTQFEACQAEKAQLVVELNQATDLANQIYTELEAKHIIV